MSGKLNILSDRLNVIGLEESANKLKALAHPLRIAIIELLDLEDEMSVTSIHERLGVEQAVASHHLSILKNRGLLIGRREGKNIFYSLKDGNLKEIVSCIERCQ